MQYRAKPVIVEASQWWPPGDPRHDPAMLSHRKGNQVSPPDFRKAGDLYQFCEIAGHGDDIFMLRTGVKDDSRDRVWPGDWLVTDSSGAKRVVTDAKFVAEFELL